MHNNWEFDRTWELKDCLLKTIFMVYVYSCTQCSFKKTFFFSFFFFMREGGGGGMWGGRGGLEKRIWHVTQILHEVSNPFLGDNLHEVSDPIF